MKIAAKLFADALTSYASAIKVEAIEEAVGRSADVKRAGDMIVIHPDFLHTLRSVCPDVEPKKTLAHMSDFLRCVAESLNSDPARSSARTLNA